MPDSFPLLSGRARGSMGATPSPNSKDPAVTIEDVLPRFLIQLEADGRSPHTVAQYRRHVRLFARWCRDVRHTGVVAEITHEDVARFLTARQVRTRPDDGEKRACTMNALRSSLRGFFGYLYRAGHIARDPTQLLRRANCGTPPPNTLSEDEQDRLLFVLSNAQGPEGRRDSAMFHLMLRCGLRVGSVVGIDVEDVDLEGGEIAVRSAKGDRPERVFLGRAIRDHLRRYIGARTTGPLFTGRAGKRLTTRHVHRRFAQWLEKAAIKRPASPHSLRHSFATSLYQRTGDVLLVKEALHHRSITSTLVYARADEERLRRAMG